MNRQKTQISFVLLGISYVIYVSALLTGSNFWGDVLSPWCALLSVITILFWKGGPGPNQARWLLLSSAGLFWFLGEILWGWCDFVIGVDPEAIIGITALFMIPNLIITVGIFFDFYKGKLGWHTVQLMLNTLVTGLIMGFFIWILFFYPEFDRLIRWNAESMILIVEILADMICLSLILVIYLTSTKKQMQFSSLGILLGSFLYSLVDLYYAYLSLNDAYIPNTLIDGVYMMAFILFAAMATLQDITIKMPLIGHPVGAPMSEKKSNFNKTYILLLAPILLIIDHGFRLQEDLLLFGIFIVYRILTSYVKIAQDNEELLILEMVLNNQLEEKIMLRTLELTEANKTLDFLNKQDELTGLYSRRYFVEALEECLSKAISSDAVFVFLMDLDRFKNINDAFGHDMGDKVLQEISKRINRWKTPDMLLARLGGDEFVLSFAGRKSESQLKDIASEIIALIRTPIIIGPYQFKTDISIGISQYPKDALDRNTLMRNADIAMYQAKAILTSNVAFFTNQESDRIKMRHELEFLLKNADYDSEFTVVFQPQLSLSDRCLNGAEALLRWNCPDKGVVSPTVFIPIAEEIGEIINIGNWVMQQAIIQSAKWNRKYGKNLQIGINVSPKQLVGHDFIDNLQALIKNNGVQPEWIDIEITESSTMNNQMQIEEILLELKTLGISVSIDDFGTGYSSLSYIKRFHINRLKIARELVMQIETDLVDSSIVHAVVLMAKGMSIQTIAEGVETEGQLDLLMALGCDQCQGYFTGRPISAKQFERLYLNKTKMVYEGILK